MSEALIQSCQVEAVLTNLCNTKDVWGEISPQYQACKKMADELLLQVKCKDEAATSEKLQISGFEEMIARLESLVIKPDPQPR